MNYFKSLNEENPNLAKQLFLMIYDIPKNTENKQFLDGLKTTLRNMLLSTNEIEYIHQIDEVKYYPNGNCQYQDKTIYLGEFVSNAIMNYADEIIDQWPLVAYQLYDYYKYYNYKVNINNLERVLNKCITLRNILNDPYKIITDEKTLYQENREIAITIINYFFNKEIVFINPKCISEFCKNFDTKFLIKTQLKEINNYNFITIGQHILEILKQQDYNFTLLMQKLNILI